MGRLLFIVFLMIFFNAVQGCEQQGPVVVKTYTYKAKNMPKKKVRVASDLNPKFLDGCTGIVIGSATVIGSLIFIQSEYKYILTIIGALIIIGSWIHFCYQSNHHSLYRPIFVAAQDANYKKYGADFFYS